MSGSLGDSSYIHKGFLCEQPDQHSITQQQTAHKHPNSTACRNQTRPFKARQNHGKPWLRRLAAATTASKEDNCNIEVISYANHRRSIRLNAPKIGHRSSLGRDRDLSRSGMPSSADASAAAWASAGAVMARRRRAFRASRSSNRSAQICSAFDETVSDMAR